MDAEEAGVCTPRNAHTRTRTRTPTFPQQFRGLNNSLSFSFLQHVPTAIVANAMDPTLIMPHPYGQPAGVHAVFFRHHFLSSGRAPSPKRPRAHDSARPGTLGRERLGMELPAGDGMDGIHVAIIGAGVGGLATASRLAKAGCRYGCTVQS